MENSLLQIDKLHSLHNCILFFKLRRLNLPKSQSQWTEAQYRADPVSFTAVAENVPYSLGTAETAADRTLNNMDC